ncbi:hypothetical protein [Flavobacterium sp. KACC 22761]|uniref:hypothetical protein n=1 Tax=Flavobacterium sp. KACC 22761 TaxID=3092665 RepID=UPI002A74FD17|nr:hypothetical protein [Flavobacterium sp. KACC 22761]WPO80389.1 hypothetical protein SCB73_08370 [Flavobacterium sp. KACC 22761]
MKIYYFFFATILLTGCSRKNPIEKALETKSNEYWRFYYNYDNTTYSTYYKFNDDKLSYNFTVDENGKFTDKPEDPYYPNEPRKWSVSSDSIMTLRGFSYDVISYNDKAIVLTYPTKEKPYQNYVFLIKEKEGDLKRYAGDYDEKRLYNPERYKVHK